MRQFVKLLVFAFAVFFAGRTVAQVEFPEDKVKWKYKVEQNGCDATLIAEISIVQGWHIYAANLPKGAFAIPTMFQPDASKKYKTIGLVLEPKPHFEHDEEADEDLYYHSGKISLRRKIKVLSATDFELTGKFSFQTCDDNHCLPPFEEKFKLKIKGCSDQASVETTPDNDSVNANDVASTDNTPSVSGDKDTSIEKLEMETAEMKTLEKDEDKGLLTIFILSFLSGFAALLTPCVFPMIPMTVSFFTKQSKTRAKGIRNAITYGLSIIVIYIALGTGVTAAFGADVLNNMSTNPTFNIVFFMLLVIFAVSFMGAFEIRMPSKWVNKADSASDRGGLIGIFFMALVLALVSFSCTGPIVGTLLVQAASEGGIAPFVGMFGFSLALALPFMLFAAFPGWMNSLPSSGGWLNTVKVVLGFLELALAFKFLSNADLAVQGHYLEREVFLAIWIAVFGALAFYLFGKIRLPHDDATDRISVGRAMLGVFTLTFVVYMIPGLWGAPLKLISAFPPPLNYSESPMGFGGSTAAAPQNFVEGTELGPQNIMVFHDYDKAKAYAEKVGKPLFVDFTGHNCVNCRKMEQSVWGEPGIIEHLRDDVVIASLHVDERIDLPKNEQVTVELAPGKTRKLTTTGDKWMYKQIKEYHVTAQPYYVMIGKDGKQLSNGSADYEHHSDPSDFRSWLENGLKEYKK